MQNDKIKSGFEKGKKYGFGALPPLALMEKLSGELFFHLLNMTEVVGTGISIENPAELTVFIHKSVKDISHLPKTYKNYKVNYEFSEYPELS